MVAFLGERMVLDIRLALYRRVQRLSCRFLHTTTTVKIMERLRGDVQQVQMLLGSQVLSLIVQLLCALVALVIMLVFSIKLTLMVLTAIVLYVANYKWFVRRIRTVQRRFRHKMDGLSGQAQEVLWVQGSQPRRLAGILPHRLQCRCQFFVLLFDFASVFRVPAVQRPEHLPE